MWYNNGNGDVVRLAVAKQTTDEGKKSQKDKTLQKYLKMFNESWTYAQDNYHTRWENNWKLYHNIRVKRNPPGVVETLVPMVAGTVNTMVATLFRAMPQVSYIPKHPGEEADTAVLNEIYQDFARRDGWALKNKINGRQGIITGNYCAYYEWKPTKDGGYVHKTIVPVRDMIIDPQSTSADDWRYVGRRFFKTKKELEEDIIYDFEKGKEVRRFSNLEDVRPGGINDTDSDKQRKDQQLGSTAPGEAGLVELIEIWTKKEVVVIANRSTIIEQRENPHHLMAKALYEQRKTEHELQRIAEYQSTGLDIGEFGEEFNESDAGLLPFAHGCDYQDVSLTYGSSDVDIIADEQELLNNITEINLEAVLYQLYPQMTIDPRYMGKIDNLDPAPGKVLPVPAGAVTWAQPPVVPTQAFSERQNIKAEIRESASVSEISKGITATDSTTATEIKAMLGQADVRIQEKAQNLADGFFFQEAKICFKLLQLYAGDSFMVRSVSDAGVEWTQVDMRKFLGDYTPMVTLDVQKKLEKAETQQAYQQAYQIVIADPTNNIEAAKRIMYKKMMPELSSAEIDEIITPAPQEAQQVTGVAPAKTVEQIPAEGAELMGEEDAGLVG